MSSAWALFTRLILRPVAREPIRAALTILAVALGVGVVIAIDLAGQAATGSFHSSIESLTGRGDLLITQTGGLDERILGRLVRLPYPLHFAPRIEAFAFIDGHGEALPFIGLDLIGSAPQHAAADSGVQDDALMMERNPVWVTPALKLRPGERVRLLLNDRMQDFTVAGVLGASGETSDQRVFIADIGLAQTLTGRIGKLDSIDVRTPADKPLPYWRNLIEQALPESASVQPQGARTEQNRKMLAAFRLNLRVLSYIALVVGAFLIYNTISVSVVRRRNDIGVVRALGGTRLMVLAGFLGEALFFAVAGSAVGLVVGRLLAIGAVKLIGSTVRALYVSSQPGAIHLTLAPAAAGVALGCAVSLVAALAPAMEAARIAPVEAMARGRQEYWLAVRSGKLFLWALPLLALAAILCVLPPVGGRPLFAYLAAVLLIAASAAATPAIVGWFAGALRLFIARLLGVEALLATRALRAALGRTSVLTAALAIAVAMTASIAIMVGSFRETVSVWINNELTADFYLRPAGVPGAGRHPVLDPGVADAIEKAPGVAAVDRFRAYAITYHGAPATLAGGETSRVEKSSAVKFLPGENRAAILSKLPTGDYAVVSEPFANKHHVHAGSILNIPLAGAVRHFQVLGIYYDYASEAGYIIVDRSTLLKYLPDPAPSNLGVYLKPRANPAAVRTAIDRVIGGRAILVSSNATLRRSALQVFDRTFRITYALEAVAVIVAIMGVAGALLATVIDRRREFAVLRFLGAAQPQVRGIILCEAGLLGLLANGIGLILGILLSLILVFVINEQSFGWTIQFHWPVALLVLSLSGVWIATVLAGLYPARIAARLNPIEVIHEE